MVKTEKGLDALTVKNIKTPGKYYDNHGLFLRVELTGSKRWVQRITIAGRQREIGLGSARLVPLAKARDLALQNKRSAREGFDPIATKTAQLSVPTFEVACIEVHSLYSPTWANKKHAAQFLSTLKTYAFPKLGRRKVSDLSPADILSVLTPIWTSKSETARRLKQRISVVMQWAIANGFRSDDPAVALNSALPKITKKPKHRKFIPYDQVTECLNVVKASKASQSTKLAIELLILTGVRSGEVRGATWSEIDFDRSVWAIPGPRMKMKEDFSIPLSQRALEILTKAKNLTDGSELIFPGSKWGRPLSDMTLSKLIKELGFDADIHGFRTSIRMWVQEKTNTPFDVAEAILAHKVGNKVTAAYARSELLEKRRDVMEGWSSYLNLSSGQILKFEG
jgi:integrase